ncbi:hypothetical protein [Nocardia sp. NPDC048505]|uniref:hypothetical protein n=1 Tax=unclassified Nocardia TaxID=2637762 RepID=UPI0033EF6FDD
MNELTRDQFRRQSTEMLLREQSKASEEGLHNVTHEALLLRGVVRDRIGGFFSNAGVPGMSGICTVCRGPAEKEMCGRCAVASSNYPGLLADRTILLTYAIGNRAGERHQSAHHMVAYKGYRGTPQAEECAEDLQLLISSVAELHRPCFEAWLGAPWDSLTFVPSKERPDRRHPLVALANSVIPPLSAAPSLQKFMLTPGPGSETKHEMTDDRYLIEERWLPVVEHKNVLIVDDTWTTGASAQGAAMAAKLAGAESVSILCVARWLRWDWADHKVLIDSLTEGFDALRCPVHGVHCTPAIQYEAPGLRGTQLFG